MSAQQSSIVVPPELRAKHPDVIALILGSESMNDEERQYWVNVLPVMTPPQVENLRTILQNEKDQLAAIDAKYSREAERLTTERTVEEVGKKHKEQRKAQHEKEHAHEEEERKHEQEILRAIAEL